MNMPDIMGLFSVLYFSPDPRGHYLNTDVGFDRRVAALGEASEIMKRHNPELRTVLGLSRSVRFDRDEVHIVNDKTVSWPDVQIMSRRDNKKLIAKACEVVMGVRPKVRVTAR